MRTSLGHLRRRVPTARQLRELAALLDVAGMTAARAFSRRYGTSIWTFPDARRANLHMLPRWVDPRDGLMLDL